MSKIPPPPQCMDELTLLPLGEKKAFLKSEKRSVIADVLEVVFSSIVTKSSLRNTHSAKVSDSVFAER